MGHMGIRSQWASGKELTPGLCAQNRGHLHSCPKQHVSYPPHCGQTSGPRFLAGPLIGLVGLDECSVEDAAHIACHPGCAQGSSLGQNYDIFASSKQAWGERETEQDG